MATAKRRSARKGAIWLKLLLGLAVLAAGLFWLFREPIAGYANAGTAFGARTACSCRYQAGRELADCSGDFEPGMELVLVSENEEEKSVTAYVPLIASETARWREGFGCVLDPWEG